MFSSPIDFLRKCFKPLPTEEPVVVQYNVVVVEGGARVLEARSRELMLPTKLGYIVPSKTVGTPTLSLRSWPLGRLEGGFEAEPTDEQLIDALVDGWEAYAAEPSADKELATLIARANASRGW